MGSLAELLSVDERKTLEFFFLGLKDVAEDNVSRDELLYNASVLAHYAQTSCGTDSGYPCPTDIAHIFDNFLDPRNAVVMEGYRDAEFCETAASQCLLMSGFFQDQQKGKHNIRTYTRFGIFFFRMAGNLEKHEKRSAFLYNFSRPTVFESWQRRQCKLSRELRATPYLLKLPTMKTKQ